MKKEKFRNLKNYEKQGPYMLYFPLILHVSLDTMKINECLENSLNHKQSRSIELNWTFVSIFVSSSMTWTNHWSKIMIIFNHNLSNKKTLFRNNSVWQNLKIWKIVFYFFFHLVIYGLILSNLLYVYPFYSLNNKNIYFN